MELKIVRGNKIPYLKGKRRAYRYIRLDDCITTLSYKDVTKIYPPNCMIHSGLPSSRKNEEIITVFYDFIGKDINNLKVHSLTSEEYHNTFKETFHHTYYMCYEVC